MGTREEERAVYFRNVQVPVGNLIGQEHGAFDVFNQMMIPERMTTAAGALGLARAALEFLPAMPIDVRHSVRRSEFEGVSFKVADSLTRLDAARALVHEAARIIDSVGNTVTPGGWSLNRRSCYRNCLAVVNDSMQIMAGLAIPMFTRSSACCGMRADDYLDRHKRDHETGHSARVL